LWNRAKAGRSATGPCSGRGDHGTGFHPEGGPCVSQGPRPEADRACYAHAVHAAAGRGAAYLCRARARRRSATDHLSALFLSYPTFTVPFCTWLLIGFFKALPDELEEAALIDGASRATAFVRVLLPLAAPGLVASAIFAFTLSWNEFLYALVFIQDERSITVPVGLNLLIYGDVFHWGQLMAASVITTIPVVALYVFIHRFMVEGLVAGSVKG